MKALFHCERCGGDRPYRHFGDRRRGSLRLASLVFPAGRLARLLGGHAGRSARIGEHLRCTVCGTCYRVELLAVPTTGQMLSALLTGTTAAVLAMLAAGEQIGEAARNRAIEAIRNAGAPDYDSARLDQALSEAAPSQTGPSQTGPSQTGPSQTGPSRAGGLRPAIETFAIQLDMPAREWFLASIVQVGLADGSLSDGQRDVAGVVARYLGLTQSVARAVIVRTEEAAQAG